MAGALWRSRRGGAAAVIAHPVPDRADAAITDDVQVRPPRRSSESLLRLRQRTGRRGGDERGDKQLARHGMFFMSAVGVYLPPPRKK